MVVSRSPIIPESILISHTVSIFSICYRTILLSEQTPLKASNEVAHPESAQNMKWAVLDMVLPSLATVNKVCESNVYQLLALSTLILLSPNNFEPLD